MLKQYYSLRMKCWHTTEKKYFEEIQIYTNHNTADTNSAQETLTWF